MKNMLSLYILSFLIYEMTGNRAFIPSIPAHNSLFRCMSVRLSLPNYNYLLPALPLFLPNSPSQYLISILPCLPGCCERLV